MIDAKNRNKLLAALIDTDITVPPRSQGRMGEHTERYAIAHLLSTLAKEDMLEYPLSLRKRERPDFVLSMPKETAGIEQTEAVAHNVAHSDFLREKGHGDDVHFVRRSEPGERKLSAKELLAEIYKNEAGGLWFGDSIERDWNRVMSFFSQRKCESAAKQGYELFPTNALLIYDNWRLPALQVKEASAMFLEACQVEGYFKTFQVIYVHTGRQLCRLVDSGVNIYGINDLWGKS